MPRARRTRRPATGGAAAPRLARAGGRVSPPPPPLLVLLERVEGLLLDHLVLVDGQQPEVEPALRLDQAAPRRLRLAQFAFGLGCELLGNPHRAAHRCERQRQETSDQAHQRRPPCESSTKLWGGSGPTSFTSTRPALSEANVSSARSKASACTRSTRNEPRSSW